MDPEDVALFHPPDEMIDDPEPVLIWPQNSETVEIFLACATQWRVAPMGGVIGLDYAAVESVMRILAVEKKDQVFAGVRLMEGVAIDIFNRRVKH